MKKSPWERVWVGIKGSKPMRWKRGWRKKTRVDDWLTGSVVPIASVPKSIRPAYRDTLFRAAEAARACNQVIWVNSSYRDPDKQARMYKENMDPLTGRPKPGRPLTAKPGTSPHERGIGLDIPDARNNPALIRELRKRNMKDDVPSEIWHITNHAMLAKGY